MKDSPFPWIVLPAYGVLFFAARINRWIDQHPHIKQPRDRIQGHITRPGRELDRRDG